MKIICNLTCNARLPNQVAVRRAGRKLDYMRFQLVQRMETGPEMKVVCRVSAFWLPVPFTPPQIDVEAGLELDSVHTVHALCFISWPLGQFF